MMIELIDLEKTFEGNRLPIFKNVNLSVKTGDLICIMGESGCGKTTLLKILGMLEMPSRGSIIFDGILTKNLNQEEKAKLRRERIGFIFQDYQLIEELTVEENIALPMYIANIEEEKINERIAEVEKQLGIEKISRKTVAFLSGGQKQRVAIARSIVNFPSVILADEPTGNLDRANTDVVMNILFGLRQRNNLTVIIVSHDIHVAAYCDKVYVLKGNGLKLLR